MILAFIGIILIFSAIILFLISLFKFFKAIFYLYFANEKTIDKAFENKTMKSEEYKKFSKNTDSLISSVLND